MKYKSYIARIEYDEDDRIFVGHLAGIKDIVGFHGSTVDELENAFHETVDNYLAICEETGQARADALLRQTDVARFTGRARGCCHHRSRTWQEYQSVGSRRC